MGMYSKGVSCLSRVMMKLISSNCWMLGLKNWNHVADK